MNMRWVHRSLVTIALLSLGAGVNLCAALYLYIKAVTSGTPISSPTLMLSPIGAWPESSVGWPAPRMASTTCLAFDTTTYIVRAQVTPIGFVINEAHPEVSRYWHEIRVGVPFRSGSQRLRQENWHVSVPSHHTPAPRLDDGFPILGVNLPCRPLWPGFIANTAFFALILFVIGLLLKRVMSQFAPLRKYRLANGLCVACGYDRRGISRELPCPECSHRKLNNNNSSDHNP